MAFIIAVVFIRRSACFWLIVWVAGIIISSSKSLVFWEVGGNDLFAYPGKQIELTVGIKH